MYYVRRLSINSQKDLCDTLSQESGKLYSNTVKFFWRIVNKKNIWLKPSSLMRIFNSHNMHAHSADASVQQFFHALSSWREVRKTIPEAKPPRKLRKYCAVVWKNSAIRVKNGELILSNGKITKPLVIEWKRLIIPTQVTLRWHGTGYELVFCYKEDNPKKNCIPKNAVGIDIGQIHVAACSDGTILNGRLLRSIRQGRNRSCSILEQRMAHKKKRSKRWQKLNKARRQLCKKTKNKAKDILHKYTTGLVMHLKNKGYNTLVVGDLTGYRVDNNCGSKRNQENHAWLYSLFTWYLQYKCDKSGIKLVKQEESYTSQTCLNCGKRKKPSGRNYRCKCGFVGHRDLVGATNILRKYLGSFGKRSEPVDGFMTHPVCIRYSPGMHVAHGFIL